MIKVASVVNSRNPRISIFTFFSLLVFFAMSTLAFAENSNEEPSEPKEEPVRAFYLGLKEALLRAEKHPERKILALETEIRAQDRRAFQLGFLPSLEVNRNWQGDFGTFDSAESFSVGASLNLFRGGVDYFGLRSRQKFESASNSNFISEWHQRQRQVASLFVNCAFESRNVDILRSSLNLRRRILEVATERYSRGIVSEEEQAKLAIDASLTESRLHTSQTLEANCKEQLRFWVGAFDEVDARSFPPFVSNLVELRVEDHPLWQSKRLEALGQEDRTRQERGDLLPTLDLVYFNQPEASFQTANDYWGLRLRWFFDRGQSLTEYRIQELREEQAREELKLTERQLQLEWKVASQTYQTRRFNLERLQKNQFLSEKIVESSLRRFRAGAVNANDVALDQSRLLDSRLALNEAWSLCLLAWLDVYVSAGKSLIEFADLAP